jgi:hypothetical protein
MEIIDNINHLLGENLKRTIKPNAKLFRRFYKLIGGELY